MTEKQFEELTNPEIADNEDPIQGLCAEIGDVIQGVYNSLLEGREAQLADETSPLDAERENLAQESADIAQAAGNLELILPASERVAQHEADELLLAGKLEEAEAARREYEEARSAPGAMKERQRQITRRIEAIADEKKSIAKHVFETWFTDLQRVIRAAERGLFIELLDKAHDEMYAYQDRHGLQGSSLLIGSLSTGLTADEHSVEWKSGQKWYSGRRR